MSKKRKISSMNNNDEEQTTTSFIDQPKSNDKIIHILETKKKSIPGIIYLSRIPNKMNVTIIRSYFDQYAPTGRIYLQLSKNETKTKRERGPKYTEGWIEFKSKRDAKLIVKQLNNQQVGGRRRTPWYDDIWNMKYLSKFHWTHLHERFQYENEIRKKRLRQEVLQAKREANLYIENVEKGRKLCKLEKKMQNSSDNINIREWKYDQQDPHENVQQQTTGLTENLLKQIFPS